MRAQWAGYLACSAAIALTGINDRLESWGFRVGCIHGSMKSGSRDDVETLCGRIITALKSQALLNESVGAGYLERKWPPALKERGAWPLSSLRKSFLNGSLSEDLL